VNALHVTVKDTFPMVAQIGEVFRDPLLSGR
jgi:hypothetical protein